MLVPTRLRAQVITGLTVTEHEVIPLLTCAAIRLESNEQETSIYVLTEDTIEQRPYIARDSITFASILTCFSQNTILHQIEISVERYHDVKHVEHRRRRARELKKAMLFLLQEGPPSLPLVAWTRRSSPCLSEHTFVRCLPGHPLTYLNL